MGFSTFTELQTITTVDFRTFFKSSPEDMFIDFRARGRGREGRRERERETLISGRNIDQLPPIYALTRDQTCNLGMCPDQGSNLQPSGVQDIAPTN